MKELSQILNKFGGVEMAVSFIVIGIMLFAYAKYADKKYRKTLAALFGVFIITSGISRGIGIFDYYDEHDLWNGIFKVISGSAGVVSMFLFPHAVREISRVQSIERTHEELEETKQKIETLKDISDKLNIRNPNEQHRKRY